MNNHDAHTGCSHEQSEHDPADATDNAGCCAQDDVDDAGQTSPHGCCGGTAQPDRHSVA